MNTERDFTAFVEAQLRQTPPLRPEALAEVLRQVAPPVALRPSSTVPLEQRIRLIFGSTRFVVAGVATVLAVSLLASVAGVPRSATAPAEGTGDIAFVDASYEEFIDELTQAPSISLVASDGGEPAPLLDIPGSRWTLDSGSWPNDARNPDRAGPAVRWSPDGSQLAFRLFNDAPGIYLADRDGSHLRRLVELPLDEDDGPPYAAALDWSPDGTRIAYTYPYDHVASPIHVVEIEGGEVTDISGDDPQLWATRTLGWSPDGSRLAFVRTEAGGLPRASRLYVMDADGTDVRELPTGPEPYPQVRALAWSPDGSTIAFALDMGDAGEGAPEHGALRVVDQDGSGLRTLLGPWENQGCCRWASNDDPLAWSPDGTSIAMIHAVGEGVDTHQAVVLVQADGTGERELMSGSWFDWSPDGTQLVIAYIGGMTTPVEPHSIHVIDADGTNARWVADGEYPAWAPAGGAD